MQYMLLIYGPDPSAGEVPEDQGEAEMARWFAYTADMVEAGVMEAGAPLQGIDTATTVRVRDGDTLSTDGPFAETAEVLGGYYLIDVPDLDQALSWAARCPAADYGSIEVRPVAELPPPPE